MQISSLLKEINHNMDKCAQSIEQPSVSTQVSVKSDMIVTRMSGSDLVGWL